MGTQTRLDYCDKTARLSDCGAYRYVLSRTWDAALGRCLFVMLNPSTADALSDDATIRRCVNFSRAWGYGALRVVNLFALRSTDPKHLYKHPDPVGPDNARTISAEAADASLVVIAWDNHGVYKGRGATVYQELFRSGCAVHCLGLTGLGEPKHPLRLAATTRPILYPPRPLSPPVPHA